MNKGLFIHLVVMAVYVALYLFVVGSEKTEMHERLMAAFIFFVIKAISIGICVDDRSYSKRITFKNNKL